MRPNQINDEPLAHTLGKLGYPGFSHLQNAPLCNPAQLLLECLRKSNLDVRVAEGLPWLLSHFEQLDTLWLVSQAKQGNLQNRLGFLTALANEVTPKPHLQQLVGELEPARLAAEQTLSNQPMPKALRDWMRQERTPLAAHWNLLTKLDPAVVSRSMKSRVQQRIR